MERIKYCFSLLQYACDWWFIPNGHQFTQYESAFLNSKLKLIQKVLRLEKTNICISQVRGCLCVFVYEFKVKKFLFADYLQLM